MHKSIVLIITLFLILTNSLTAQIIVHEPNFVVDKLLDQIDGQTPRLESIRNPDYGFGVVAASVNQGILTIRKITQGSFEVIATKTNLPSDASALDIRFDTSGLFANKLFVSVLSNQISHTDILEIYPYAEPILRLSLGSLSNRLAFFFDFVADEYGYMPGMYLFDYNNDSHKQSIYHMNTNFEPIVIAQHSIPPGRTDIDQIGLELDSAGYYENYFTLPEWDDNDKIAGIYQLRPDLTWKVLKTPQSWTSIHYRDLAFSSGGAFGQKLYVTERKSDDVLAISPNGDDTPFASGFSQIESITISEDGEHMFVSDENGVYRIRSGTMAIGPTLVMQEPKVASDGVFTDTSGVTLLRLLWNEAVIFTDLDISIIDEDSNPISLSASGSNSQFMIVAFGKILKNNKYTIIIHDSVVSADTGHAIDGDNNGLAGGDAIIVMEHRERHDSDNDNDIDLPDLVKFAEKWLWIE